MPTYTTNLNLAKPLINDEDDAGPTGWPLYINNNFDTIDTQIQALIDDKIDEAPADGDLYARRGSVGEWVVIDEDLGLAGIGEAPTDDNIYGRMNAAWTQLPAIPESFTESGPKGPSNTVAQTNVLDKLFSSPPYAGRVFRVSLGGTFLQNASASETVILRVKYGATTIWQSSPIALAQSANTRAWWADIIFYFIGAASQNVTGFISIGGTAAPTTGSGDIVAGAVQNPIYGTAAENSESELEFAISAQLSVASANFNFRMQQARQQEI